MNLSDSSFLCLDIGSSRTSAFAVRIKNGRIAASTVHSCDSSDAAFAIKSAVESAEAQLGVHFDSAFITGNFGIAEFRIARETTDFGREHKITDEDLNAQIKNAIEQISADFTPLHIIPLRYDISSFPNIAQPVGQTDSKLSSAFGVITAEKESLLKIQAALRAAQIESNGFFDSDFLVASTAKPKKQTAAIIGIGAEHSTVSVWTTRGPVMMEKLPLGLSRIADALAAQLGISFNEAARVMRGNLSLERTELYRFAPADTAYDFSKADLNDTAAPFLQEILCAIAAALEKYPVEHTYLYGGGAGIQGIEKAFPGPVRKMDGGGGFSSAAAAALAGFVWKRESQGAAAISARRDRYEHFMEKLASVFRKRKKKHRFIPIMPSTLAFDMNSPQTYKLFESAGISMIHCDIMDGFFVDKIVGGIDELRKIRAQTHAYLNVHLMTESPLVWAEQAAGAGADTITISAGTAGVRAALARIKELGKRAGIALPPESTVEILKPILREIDEVLVMSVRPGAGGQEFMRDALYKISTLANTRKKYELKFKISVDGGINPETAKLCWAAGADFLVSGAYLAKAADFPLAVHQLMQGGT